MLRRAVASSGSELRTKNQGSETMKVKLSRSFEVTLVYLLWDGELLLRHLCSISHTAAVGFGLWVFAEEAVLGGEAIVSVWFPLVCYYA